MYARVGSHYNFADADECAAGTDTCDQICLNTMGSYTCSCNTGYTLNSDRTTCDGMWTCDGSGEGSGRRGD